MAILVLMSWRHVPSLDLMDPRYLKLSTFSSCVPLTFMVVCSSGWLCFPLIDGRFVVRREAPVLLAAVDGVQNVFLAVGSLSGRVAPVLLSAIVGFHFGQRPTFCLP